MVIQTELAVVGRSHLVKGLTTMYMASADNLTPPIAPTARQDMAVHADSAQTCNVNDSNDCLLGPTRHCYAKARNAVKASLLVVQL